MDSSFNEYQEGIQKAKTELDNQIKEYEARQNTIIEQFKRAEEMKVQRNYYRIQVSDADKHDIQKLKMLAQEFGIYEVYYKAKLEELFKRILAENKDKGGIYKITNINNEKVYIGRCVKFLDRWRTHSKRGCNIDRISGQLYDAMWEEGLDSFTWEIVEVCTKEEQAAKEKYWVEFYNAQTYGYNAKGGG